MFCKLLGLLPLFLLLLLFAASGGRLDAGTQTETLVRPNLADWRCHTGDDLRWAQPDWDDHDWAPCSLDPRPSLGLFWGRLHVRLPEPATTRWSIGTLLPSTGVLYANGQEIASSGRVSVRSRSLMPVYRIVSLPPFSHPGQPEIVVATRVQRSFVSGGVDSRFLAQRSAAVDLELGKEGTLQQWQQLYTFWVPKLDALPWMWLATIPCMLLPLSITLQEAGRRNREARVLAPTMIFYATMITWVNLFIAGGVGAAGGLIFLSGWFQYPTWHLGVAQLGGVEISQAVFLLTTAVVLADRARRTSLEQARLAGEMAAAQQVQRLLVPASRVTVGPYQIESAYFPSEQVGGDFFQLVPNEDGSLLVVVADVSGKGLKAAMVVSLMMGALQQIRRETAQPAAVLRSLNEVLSGHTEGGFVTCCCARIECSGQVHLASAGHLLPYLNGEEIAVDSGLPLGVLPEAH